MLFKSFDPQKSNKENFEEFRSMTLWDTAIFACVFLVFVIIQAVREEFISALFAFFFFGISVYKARRIHKTKWKDKNE